MPPTTPDPRCPSPSSTSSKLQAPTCILVAAAARIQAHAPSTQLHAMPDPTTHLASDRLRLQIVQISLMFLPLARRVRDLSHHLVLSTTASPLLAASPHLAAMEGLAHKRDLTARLGARGRVANVGNKPAVRCDRDALGLVVMAEWRRYAGATELQRLASSVWRLACAYGVRRAALTTPISKTSGEPAIRQSPLGSHSGTVNLTRGFPTFHHKAAPPRPPPESPISLALDWSA
ncbi:unnamed protein product [Cutaneotrichosporon oleaginosum]